MPNFDALRSAVVGPLSYLCKPQKPEELLGLWTLQGNLGDLSRYDRKLNAMNAPTYSSGGYGLCASMASAVVSIPVSGNFSLEFIGLPVTSFFIGTYEFRYGNGYGNWWLYVYNGSSQVTNKNLTEGGGTDNLYSHCAMCRIGSTLYFSYNGTVKHSMSFSNDLTSLSITSPAIQNVRLVSKALGTSSSYPVPSNLYTGFEPL